MATYRVKPNGNGWTVTKNGTTASNHRKKARARQSAKRQSSGGDKLVIHGGSGQILSQTTRR